MDWLKPLLSIVDKEPRGYERDTDKLPGWSDPKDYKIVVAGLAVCLLPHPKIRIRILCDHSNALDFSVSKAKWGTWLHMILVPFTVLNSLSLFLN